MDVFEAAEDFNNIDTKVENLEIYWIESVGALGVDLRTQELLIFLLLMKMTSFMG